MCREKHLAESGHVQWNDCTKYLLVPRIRNRNTIKFNFTNSSFCTVKLIHPWWNPSSAGRYWYSESKSDYHKKTSCSRLGIKSYLDLPLSDDLLEQQRCHLLQEAPRSCQSFADCPPQNYWNQSGFSRNSARRSTSDFDFKASSKHGHIKSSDLLCPRFEDSAKLFNARIRVCTLGMKIIPAQTRSSCKAPGFVDADLEMWKAPQIHVRHDQQWLTSL